MVATGTGCVDADSGCSYFSTRPEVCKLYYLFLYVEESFRVSSINETDKIELLYCWREKGKIGISLFPFLHPVLGVTTESPWVAI